MQTVPFKAAHAARLRIQSAQAWMGDMLCAPDMATLEQPHATTILDGDTVLLCAGAIELWPGRAYIWSVLSAEFTPRKFLRMQTIAKDWVANLPFDRIEAAVEASFEAGHRWVISLGFTRETEDVMRKFMDGRDFVLYARVKE
ncbi:MAG: hypothetical protein KG075_09545 [Alphaproteobacteria bacterium]|nr:hypothetical protein [Alphaproteobacteria bacterium]